MSKSGFCCSALLGLVLFVGLNAKPPTCHTLRQLKDESAKMFPQLRESPTFASTGRGEKTASDDDVEMTMVVSFELGSQFTRGSGSACGADVRASERFQA